MLYLWDNTPTTKGSPGTLRDLSSDIKHKKRKGVKSLNICGCRGPWSTKILFLSFFRRKSLIPSFFSTQHHSLLIENRERVNIYKTGIFFFFKCLFSTISFHCRNHFCWNVCLFFFSVCLLCVNVCLPSIVFDCTPDVTRRRIFGFTILCIHI